MVYRIKGHLKQRKIFWREYSFKPVHLEFTPLFFHNSLFCLAFSFFFLFWVGKRNFFLLHIFQKNRSPTSLGSLIAGSHSSHTGYCCQTMWKLSVLPLSSRNSLKESNSVCSRAFWSSILKNLSFCIKKLISRANIQILIFSFISILLVDSVVL